MFFNETQETKNFDITFNYLNQSIESLRYLASFIKQYCEITKTYIEKIHILLDKTRSKLSVSHEEPITQNTKFTSTKLTNRIIRILKFQNDSMKDISSLDLENVRCLSQIEILLENAQKNIDTFNEIKMKLFDKYRETEKAKQKFFKEASNTEKILTKAKKQKRKSGQSQSKEDYNFTKESKAQLSMIKPSTHIKQTSTFNFEHNMSLNNKFLSRQKTISSEEMTFPKLKDYEQRYIKSVNDYNLTHNEFNETNTQIINSMIKLNKNCNGCILNYINEIIMYIKGHNKISSLEIEEFLNDFSSGIDELVEESIKSNFILNNPIPKLKEEQYRITVIDNYKQKIQDHKTRLTEDDIKDIIKSISCTIKIKDNEPPNQKREKTKVELEKITKKLLFKDYNFFPLKTDDKTLLYDLLSDFKFRYWFLTLIEPSTPELELSNKQFQIFADIFSFILDKSFSEKDHISIFKVLNLSEKLYKILSRSKHRRNILKRIKSLPLFKNMDFWLFIIEQSIYEEIQVNPLKIEITKEKEKAQNHLSSFISLKIINYWFFIAQTFGIEVAFVEEILFKNIMKFNLDYNSVKKIYLYLKKEYFIQSEIEDDIEDEEEDQY